MKIGDRYINCAGVIVTVAALERGIVTYEGGACGSMTQYGFSKHYEPLEQPTRKPDFYVPVAVIDGENIAITHHARQTVATVHHSVMQAARREGFTGTLAERLNELEWVVRPVYIGDTES